jgi:hypothetical protein
MPECNMQTDGRHSMTEQRELYMTTKCSHLRSTTHCLTSPNWSARHAIKGPGPLNHTTLTFMLGVSSVRMNTFLCSGLSSPRDSVIKPLVSTRNTACTTSLLQSARCHNCPLSSLTCS